MNLDILELLDSYVHWRLNGQDGNSFIKDGKVHDTYLCEGPFDMKPDTMGRIADKVQEWLDDPHNKLGHDQKVEEVRFKLLALGAKVRVRRRQLAHREKTYLHIAAEGNISEWKSIIKPIILSYFPDAYMTSGGFFSKMNITVALEK